MCAFFVGDDIVKLYQTTMSQLRSDLGRYVIVRTANRTTKCPNCIYDPMNRRSANIYSPSSPYPSGILGPVSFTGGVCPICKGIGTYSSDLQTSVLCLIKWIKKNELSHETQGTFEEGDVQLKANIQYYDILKKAKSITVDGIVCYPISVSQAGLRDPFHAIVIASKGLSQTNPAG